ncbi:putative DNA binding domain-containing protein, partial [Candidatus Parcubacteria bacterium]|nr:putative DNA binding domain-containing protein [Candidatus Parcubacteria bacterium]
MKKMTKQELKFILQQGEGLRIEFKEQINNIDKEIIAFANSKGGRIFLGVDDKGKIKGVNITNKLKSQIQDIARNCDPLIDIKIKKFDDIVIIEVKEGKDKPYKCSSGFYLRQGANSQKMSRDEILDFAIGEGKIRFDEQINYKFDFKKDFDEEKLNKYLLKAKISKTISDKEILVNLDVAKINGNNILFNNAGVLFFAKHPCKIIPQAYITCVRFNGIENVDIIDRLDFNEDIISNIDNAIKFVKRNTKLSYEIKDIQRKE